jgi:hypothetical protein
MTQLSDFVVINSGPIVAQGGKWRSPPFESGGRLIRKLENVEQDNAYVTVTLTASTGGPDFVAVRVIINDHPLPVMVGMEEGSQHTRTFAFIGSFLKNGNGNVLALHSEHERTFQILHAICHFRQES